jgi:hypothetical protein
MAHKSQLAVLPRVIEFRPEEDPKAEERLLAMLDDCVKHTQMSLVAKEQDILLFKNCKVRGVFQLSLSALETLCIRLAPGVFQAVAHVSGLRPVKRAVDRAVTFSDEAAASILNRLIQLRFGNIKGHRLVLNHQTKTVDGLVGRSYAFFSNRDLYQAAFDFVRSQYSDIQLGGATLAGRRLLFNLFDPDPLIVDLPGYGREEFFTGFHFSNAEVGGYSLRVASTITHARTNATAISPFVNGGKMTHQTDKNFFEQLQKLFLRAAKRVRQYDEMRAWLTSLASTKLGLVVNRSVRDDRKDVLASQLQRRGLTREMADAVMARTILFPGASARCLVGEQNTSTTKSNLATLDLEEDRTCYDIFLALTTEAKDQRIKRRELLEQVAFDLLSGKVPLATFT